MKKLLTILSLAISLSAFAQDSFSGYGELIIPETLRKDHRNGAQLFSVEKCPAVVTVSSPCTRLYKDLNGKPLKPDSYTEVEERITLRSGWYRITIDYTESPGASYVNKWETIFLKLNDNDVKTLPITSVQLPSFTGPGKVIVEIYKKNITKQLQNQVLASLKEESTQECKLKDSLDPFASGTNYCILVTRWLKNALAHAESENVRIQSKKILESGVLTLEILAKLFFVPEGKYKFSGLGWFPETVRFKLTESQQALEYLKTHKDFIVVSLDEEIQLQSTLYQEFDLSYFKVAAGEKVLLPNGSYSARYVNESGDEYTTDFVVNGESELVIN